MGEMDRRKFVGGVAAGGASLATISGPVVASPAKCALSPIIANTRTEAPGRGAPPGSVTVTCSTESRSISATGTGGATDCNDTGSGIVS